MKKFKKNKKEVKPFYNIFRGEVADKIVRHLIWEVSRGKLSL